MFDKYLEWADVPRFMKLGRGVLRRLTSLLCYLFCNKLTIAKVNVRDYMTHLEDWYAILGSSEVLSISDSL